MESIIKIPCKENMIARINQTLERLRKRGFSAVFNGNNFDIIDSTGKCLNSEYGIDFNVLEEYSLLEHYFIIGEKIIITNTRTKKERCEIYDEHKHENGRRGIIEQVAVGNAYGIGECLLFSIRIEDRYTSDYISGDFELA